MLAAIALGLMGCVASQPLPVSGDGARVIGRADGELVVVPGPGDTLQTLASQFLGDPSLYWQIADANDTGALTPGREVVVPLEPRNPTGVYDDGYQVVPILNYHRFDRSGNRLAVRPEDFRAHLEYLAQNDYRVVALDDVLAFMRGERALPKRAVAITIDDGYRSTYEVAYPLLVEFGYPATVFVYSDFVGRGGMSYAQLSEMEGSGLIDIQAHSKTHADLTKQLPGESHSAYRNRIEREIDDPARRLSGKLGEDIRQYAYPYGAANSYVMERSAGERLRHGFDGDPGTQRVLRPSVRATALDGVLGSRHAGLRGSTANVRASLTQMNLADPSTGGGPARLKTLALVLASLLASGCQHATVSSRTLSAEDAALAAAAAERRTGVARSLEAQGALARALDEWRIVAALSPGSGEAAEAVARLSASVRSGADARVNEALDAQSRGQRASATTAALRALALDPANEQAQAVLRELESGQVVRRKSFAPVRLTRKPVTGDDDDAYVSARAADPEPPQVAQTGAKTSAPAKVDTVASATRGVAAVPAQPAAAPARAPAPESPTQALKSGEATKLADAKAPASSPVQPDSGGDEAAAREALEAGQAARASGNLEKALSHFERAVALSGDRSAQAAVAKLRAELGERYYAEGLRAFRTDVDGAISALERSVKYDPANTQAQLKLLAARETRERLSQIQ